MPMPNSFNTLTKRFVHFFFEKKIIAALVMSIGKFKRELDVLRQVYVPRLCLCTPSMSGPSTT